MGKRQTSSATALRRGCWVTFGRFARTLVYAGGCVSIGVISAAIAPQDEWYAALRKPTWMPPGWLFGVVWTVLYATMGIALSLVLERGLRAPGVKRVAILFAIQLALNFAWSPIFFGFHSPGGALIVILALWLMIGWTIAAFWSVRDIAGVLMLPYWAWVTFAAGLNATIWRMNG